MISHPEVRQALLLQIAASLDDHSPDACLEILEEAYRLRPDIVVLRSWMGKIAQVYGIQAIRDLYATLRPAVPFSYFTREIVTPHDLKDPLWLLLSLR